MKKNKGKCIILLIGILIIAIVLIVMVLINRKINASDQQSKEQVKEEKYTEELEDGTKINTSEELNNIKNYGDLEISNIQYTEKDSISVLLADVKNNGTTIHKEEIVKITILGENGEIIAEIKPVIGRIEPGESIKLNATITADVVNGKDFKIESAN